MTKNEKKAPMPEAAAEQHVETEAASNEAAHTAGEKGSKAPKAKKPRSRKKTLTVVGVIAAVIVVAGIGFLVWHEQPSFCNAICHTPMDPYLPTYEAPVNEQGIDKWGNDVSDCSAMMAPVHREENGDTCLSCHVPTLGEQVSEGMHWITGNYEVLETQTGQMVVPEKSLEELVAARGIEPDQFCLNESCHNMTRDQLKEATADFERNPHQAQHGERSCSDCHKAHRASINACSECHDDADIPEGWITHDESEKLVKELESLNK